MTTRSSWISKLTKKFTACYGSKGGLTIFDDEAAVEAKAKADQRVLVMYKDNVYDITTYLDKHPGGKEILVMASSKIIDKVFDKYHYPKGDAPGIMKKYLIGVIVRNPAVTLTTEPSQDLSKQEI